MCGEENLVLSIHPPIFFFLEYFRAGSRQVIPAIIFHSHCNEFILTLHPGLQTLWGVPPGLPSALGYGVRPGVLSPPHACSFPSGLCLSWWFRGHISFLPGYLPPASADLAGVIHAERLSQLWEGAAGSTFHNKYLFKRPGVQARFSFPRRLLTDDLKNCFPMTDRGMKHPRLPVPSLSEVYRSCGFKGHRLLPAEAFTQLQPAFLCPCEAAGCQPGGLLQWDAFLQEIHVKGLQGQGELGPPVCQQPAEGTVLQRPWNPRNAKALQGGVLWLDSLDVEATLQKLAVLRCAQEALGTPTLRCTFLHPIYHNKMYPHSTWNATHV